MSNEDTSHHFVRALLVTTTLKNKVKDTVLRWWKHWITNDNAPLLPPGLLSRHIKEPLQARHAAQTSEIRVFKTTRQSR